MLSLQIVAFASEQTNMSATATIDKENKLVAVQIDINSVSPFCGCSFNLVYNNEILEFVDLSNGEVIEGATVIANENFSENSIRIVSASALELPQTGTIATVTFLYDTTKSTEVDFDIENCKIVGVNGEKIDCEVNNTSITINKKAEKPSNGGTITITPPSKDDEKDVTEDSTDDIVKEEPKGDEEDTSSTIDDKDEHQDVDDVEKDENNETTDTTGATGNESPASPDEDYEVFLMSFSDVADSDWFYDSVKYVYEQKLMNGVSVTEFAPNANLTRAMLVTILYRIENEPLCGDPLFEDVEKDMWYTKSIAWASENNIVKGVGEGLFAPNANITREQIAVILYNYANFKNESTDNKATLDKYTDNTLVSVWAEDAIEWAVGEGIITGKTVTTLEPQGQATRAEAATMLMRYLKNN